MRGKKFLLLEKTEVVGEVRWRKANDKFHCNRYLQGLRTYRGGKELKPLD